mgnify:CR=1 FL=1
MRSKIEPDQALGPKGTPAPPKKMKIRLSSHTRLQESKPPGQHPIIKEIQGKNNKHKEEDPNTPLGLWLGEFVPTFIENPSKIAQN